jgi:hypothetical protein
MGWLVPQPCVTGGNRSNPDFWAVTDDPRYPGYKTLIVAPKPSVEHSGQSCSLDGRQNRYSYDTTGTATGFGGKAMGLKPPCSYSKSRGGTHRVAPQAAAEL